MERHATKQTRHVWALLLGAAGALSVACSSNSLAVGPGGAPVTLRGGGSDAAADAQVGSARQQTGPASKTCTPDAGGSLVCDASKVSGVPWGSPVTVGTGTGTPPAPTGGDIVSGDYQLVSETMYGTLPLDVAGELPGDQTQSIIHVEGDVMNQLLRFTAQGGSGAGNYCSRLVSCALGVLDVSGWYTTTPTPPVPDLRSDVSYTMKGRDLVLSFLSPYTDGAGLILGSYTRVEVFAPIGTPVEPVINEVATNDTGSGRDARCPPSPPAAGDPCSPDPAPLECEYGGDAWRRCTTLVECALQLDGTFRFQIATPQACTPPNPPACPGSFAAASALSAPPGGEDGGTSDVSCNYPDGLCACVPHTFQTEPRCAWTCGAGTPQSSVPGSSCPPQRPLAGDPCSGALECDYESECAPGLSIGPDMRCTNGHWEATHRLLECPAF